MSVRSIQGGAGRRAVGSEKVTVRMRHHEMRQRVVNATLAVIAREGLEAASVRTIARELGCTTGVISHYFNSKDELLAFAIDSISRDLARTFTSTAPPDDPLREVVAIARSFLAVDAQQRTRWRAWLAFLPAALWRPDQLERQQRRYGQLRAHLLVLFRRLQRSKRLKPGLDVELEVDLLLATMDGIGLHGSIRPKEISASRQVQLLNRHFRTLLR